MGRSAPSSGSKTTLRALWRALWPAGPLVAIAVALAATVAGEMRHRTVPVVAVTAPVASESVLAAVAVPVGYQEVSAVALARPLFASGRRPRQALAARPAGAAKLPRVSGTILSSGRKVAIFIGAGEAGKGEGRPIVVAEGGVVDGFLVTAIEPGRVTVTGPSGRQILVANFDPNRPPPSAPMLPPPTYHGLPSLLPTANSEVPSVASLALPPGSPPTVFPPRLDIGTGIPGLPGLAPPKPPGR